MNDILSILFWIGINVFIFIINRELEKKHEREVERFLNGTDE